MKFVKTSKALHRFSELLSLIFCDRGTTEEKIAEELDFLVTEELKSDKEKENIQIGKEKGEHEL